MKSTINKFIKISLWSFAIVFIAQLLYSYNVDEWENKTLTDITTISISIIGKSITCTTIIMSIFNKFAWKWQLFQYIHDVPVLKKTYEGKILSTHDGIERDGKMFINQSFLNVSVRLTTNESQSRSVTSYLDIGEGFCRIIYTYQNEPHAEIQDRSPIHYGTAILNVCDTEIMEGDYFTGRRTTGSMKFNAIPE